MKPSSKKKRSRKEMEEVKHEEDLLNRDKQAFLKDFKRLKDNDIAIEKERDGSQKNQELLNKLFASGVIDAKGNIVKGNIHH